MSSIAGELVTGLASLVLSVSGSQRFSRVLWLDLLGVLVHSFGSVTIAYRTTTAKPRFANYRRESHITGRPKRQRAFVRPHCSEPQDLPKGSSIVHLLSSVYKAERVFACQRRPRCSPHPHLGNQLLLEEGRSVSRKVRRYTSCASLYGCPILVYFAATSVCCIQSSHSYKSLFSKSLYHVIKFKSKGSEMQPKFRYFREQDSPKRPGSTHQQTNPRVQSDGCCKLS